MANTTGKIAPINEDMYRQLDAVSSTDLKILNDSPRALWLARQSQRETTVAMEFGTAFHCAILETEKFRSMYVCEPDRMPDGKIAGIGPKETHVNRNTTMWKDFIAFWREENKHKLHLEPKDFSMLLLMVNGVVKNDFVMGLLKDSDKEMATIWTDKATGLKCKGRADVAGDALVDFKTTSCRNPKEFERDAYYRLVHMQMAMYHTGFEANGHTFKDHYVVALRKDYDASEVEPWIFKYDQGLLDKGREKARQLLEKYKKCKETDVWPGLGDQIFTMSVPPWALVELAENGEANNGTVP